MSEPKYHVGQELWRHDVNEGRRGFGGPQRVTVAKVGRSLVTIERFGRPETFRIETGRANDKYGHGSLCTDEEHSEHLARSEVLERLQGHGLRFDWGMGRVIATATLASIADLLDAHATRSAPTTAAGDDGEGVGADE